jgi:hypothetical protein
LKIADDFICGLFVGRHIDVSDGACDALVTQESGCWFYPAGFLTYNFGYRPSWSMGRASYEFGFSEYSSQVSFVKPVGCHAVHGPLVESISGFGTVWREHEGIIISPSLQVNLDSFSAILPQRPVDKLLGLFHLDMKDPDDGSVRIYQACPFQEQQIRNPQAGAECQMKQCMVFGIAFGEIQQLPNFIDFKKLFHLSFLL